MRAHVMYITGDIHGSLSWDVSNVKCQSRHIAHTHTHTHSDKHMCSNGSSRRSKWQRQELPITTASDLTTILPASIKCALSHSRLPQLQTHTRTQESRTQNETHAMIHPYTAKISLLHREETLFSLLPPSTAAFACHRERHEATFRKQKGAVALLRWRAHTRRRLQLQCKRQDERGAATLPHSLSTH